MHAADLIRPYVLLALTAFIVGFLGCIAFAQRPADALSIRATPTTAWTPPSADAGPMRAT